MPLLSWQLWLAKEKANDTPLPWQAAQEEQTPAVWLKALLLLLPELAPQPNRPKPRGKISRMATWHTAYCASSLSYLSKNVPRRRNPRIFTEE
jgi:hypothetical protein